MARKLLLVATSFALLLVLAACGGDSDPPAEEGSADGVQTIEVTALDDLSFDPEAVDVQAGETVRFVVTNEGQALHDFFVGTEVEQMDHESEMAEGMDHEAEPESGAVTLESGETREIMVTFDEPGTVLYGCHQPGHYAGGMVGTITVS